jgi:RNA polymerase sigma factor (sigma-70 family)
VRLQGKIADPRASAYFPREERRMPDQKGDRLLGDLARERGSALTSYAYLLTGDVAAAQDLVQDAPVKVFVRTRKGFTPDAAEAYVRHAILTLYIDGYRRRRIWASVRHLFNDGESSGCQQASTADRIDLQAALATLAPQERATVVLRFYEDLTVPEIADQMQVSAGSIKRYLSNGIHKLEGILGPMPETHDSSDSVVVVETGPAPTKRSGS